MIPDQPDGWLQARSSPHETNTTPTIARGCSWHRVYSSGLVANQYTAVCTQWHTTQRNKQTSRLFHTLGKHTKKQKHELQTHPFPLRVKSTLKTHLFLSGTLKLPQDRHSEVQRKVKHAWWIETWTCPQNNEGTYPKHALQTCSDVAHPFSFHSLFSLNRFPPDRCLNTRTPTAVPNTHCTPL